MVNPVNDDPTIELVFLVRLVNPGGTSIPAQPGVASHQRQSQGMANQGCEDGCEDTDVEQGAACCAECFTQEPGKVVQFFNRQALGM